MKKNKRQKVEKPITDLFPQFKSEEQIHLRNYINFDEFRKEIEFIVILSIFDLIDYYIFDIDFQMSSKNLWRSKRTSLTPKKEQKKDMSKEPHEFFRQSNVPTIHCIQSNRSSFSNPRKIFIDKINNQNFAIPALGKTINMRAVCEGFSMCISKAQLTSRNKIYSNLRPPRNQNQNKQNKSPEKFLDLNQFYKRPIEKIQKLSKQNQSKVAECLKNQNYKEQCGVILQKQQENYQTSKQMIQSQYKKLKYETEKEFFHQKALNVSQLKQILTQAFDNILKNTFQSFINGKISFKQTKIYCTREILKIIVKYNRSNPIKAQNIKQINSFIKYKILPYLNQQYLQVQNFKFSKKLQEQIKNSNHSSVASFNYLQNCQIPFEYRQSGNYNDLIMQVLNNIVSKVDSPSSYQLGNTSNYSDFENMMEKIFEIVEDFNYMNDEEWKTTKIVLAALANKFDQGNQSLAQYSQLNQNDFYLSTQKRFSQLSLQKQFMLHQQAKQKYAAKVREYTHFQIGRKAPEGVGLYSEKEINSLNLTFKHFSVIRIIEKWCFELNKKFQEQKQFHNMLDILQRGQHINPLSLSMRNDLDYFMTEEKKEIDKFMVNLRQSNYKIMELLLKRQQTTKTYGYFQNIQWQAAQFSLDSIANFQNYLVTYLNRLIHGLLHVAKRFYNKTNVNNLGAWPSPPNLLTLSFGDLMRCRIESREKQILKIFKHLHLLSNKHPERFKIVQIKNRLNSMTRDVSVIGLFNNSILCQVQIAIVENMSKLTQASYEFSHFIYELQRSPFGPFIELCNTWVKCDKRFQIYQKQRKQIKSKITPSLQLINNCKTHQTVTERDAFICYICNNVYSHNNFIKDHIKCTVCKHSICARCSIDYQKKNNLRKLKNQIILNPQLNSICGQIIQFKGNPIQFPKSGVCIQIQTNKPRVQLFQLIQYQKQMFLLAKNGQNKYYQIAQVSSSEKMNDFFLNYLVFKSKQSKSFEEREAVINYILPKTMSFKVKEDKQKLLLSYELDDDAIVNLFNNIFEDNDRKKMRRVSLDSNKITDIKSVVDFQNLQWLQLSFNPIRKFKGLEQLTQLRHLFLVECGLKTIPEQIYNITTLLELRISNNKIQAISSKISQLKKLRQLEMTSNLLVNLPESLSQCKSLKILRFDNNPHLETVPASFGKLFNLEKLILSKTKISHLPQALCQLSKLKLLRLEQNRLTQLPQNIGTLSNLQHLDISHNLIEQLSVNFASLRHLKIFNCSFNPKLKNLPNNIGNCKKLEEVYLHNCVFQELPQQFCKLAGVKILDISNNNLKSIPSLWYKLTSLEKVDLSYNQLQDGSNFKNAWKSMFQLREINLSKNNLNQIPIFSFCTKLQKIQISENKIKKIRGEAFSGLNNLQYLNASGNQIEQVDGSIMGLFRLIEINLSNNKIKNISKIQQNEKKWPNLQVLNFSNNKFSAFPEYLIECNRLKKINFSKNEITALKDSIFKMKQLNEVNFSFNQIKECNQKWKDMPNLKVLLLRSGKLRSISSQKNIQFKNRKISIDLMRA